MIRKMPSTAYTPMIICSYSDWRGSHMKPAGQIMVRGRRPTRKIRPTMSSAIWSGWSWS